MYYSKHDSLKKQQKRIIKGWIKMCHANIYQKIAGIHILISEDVNIRRNIINHKDDSHNDKRVSAPRIYNF